MQTELNLTFDFDDEDEKEKFEKVSNIMLEKEEDCCDDDESPCKDVLETFEEKLQEFENEVKAGSLIHKMLEKVREAFQDSLDEHSVELN